MADTAPTLEDLLALHEGGKLATVSTTDLQSLEDLRRIYTPGVARVCLHLQEHPERYLDYTMAGHTVGIVTNGTAVLGLGDIGARAGMPVMEGKAVLLKTWGGVDAFPILIESRDPDVVVETVERMYHGFGAIMLEDIAAPECFAIENRLKESLPVPVFHDDQHGTAVVTLATLLHGLAREGRRAETMRVVISGAGAAGVAIAKMLRANDFGELTLCDSKGAVYPGRPAGMNPAKEEIAALTNPEGARTGSLADCLAGADIFVGVSRQGLVTQAMVRSMNDRPFVLAMANPEGEIPVEEALAAGAALAADGKMVNNALGFPGIFRGALQARATAITPEMQTAAARAIAEIAPEDDILPSFLDPAVHDAVAHAVAQAWQNHPLPKRP
jgi:malate dehydrogenase (oxaloacetate-decarboxylating)